MAGVKSRVEEALRARPEQCHDRAGRVSRYPLEFSRPAARRCSETEFGVWIQDRDGTAPEVPVDHAKEKVPFAGLHVSVATPATLYRMKRNTVRLKDRADAELLKQRFGLTEED